MYSNNAKYRKWKQFSLREGIKRTVVVYVLVAVGLRVFIALLLFIERFHRKMIAKKKKKKKKEKMKMRGNKRLETAPAEIAIFCFTVITVLSPRRKKNKKVKQKNLRSSVIRESPCFRFVRSSCSGERLTRCVAFPSEYCGDLRKGSA